MAVCKIIYGILIEKLEGRAGAKGATAYKLR
jgi:hypothetical protein